MPRRIFVSFEGGEGSGKSTQATLLCDRLAAEGFKTVLVREPGSTDLGWYLRRYLKGDHGLGKKAELLLFLAARAELVRSIIEPGLAKGDVIVADRFTDSSLAYQGFGRQINLEAIRYMNDFVVDSTIPDTTFLLDLDPKQGLERVGQFQLRLPLEVIPDEAVARLEEEGQQGFEHQPLAFHDRIRRGYRELARREQGRWVVIDARQSVDAIGVEVWDKVKVLLTTEPNSLPLPSALFH